MYEWDEAKNAADIAKHGVSFDLARLISARPASERERTRYAQALHPPNDPT